MNLTDSNSIRKCVQRKIDVAVLVVRGGLHGGGERGSGGRGSGVLNDEHLTSSSMKAA